MKAAFVKIFLLSLALSAGSLCFAQTRGTTAQSLPVQESELSSEEDFPEFDPEIAKANGYDVKQDSKTGEYKVASPLAAVWKDILKFLERFLFNLLVSWIIVHFFYFRRNGRSDYYFTFLIFSSAMFIMLFVMNNLSLQIGFTLGLFAVFGMIRYRTEAVPVREMTYLFVIIGLSVVNGVGADLPLLEVVAANLVMVLLIWVLESGRIARSKTSTKLVIYDRIELITPDRREELKADLEKRIGVTVKEIEIGQVDFLKDSAWIKITYLLPEGERGEIDHLTKTREFQESK